MYYSVGIMIYHHKIMGMEKLQIVRFAREFANDIESEMEREKEKRIRKYKLHTTLKYLP